MPTPEWPSPPTVVSGGEPAHEELDIIEMELLLEAIYLRGAARRKAYR